jgi:hypothetical protein
MSLGSPWEWPLQSSVIKREKGPSDKGEELAAGAAK